MQQAIATSTIVRPLRSTIYLILIRKNIGRIVLFTS